MYLPMLQLALTTSYSGMGLVDVVPQLGMGRYKKLGTLLTAPPNKQEFAPRETLHGSSHSLSFQVF